MKDTDSMTMQDVLEMMKCIREFFTVVRLESGYDTMDSEETYCEIEYLKEDIFFYCIICFVNRKFESHIPDNLCQYRQSHMLLPWKNLFFLLCQKHFFLSV